MTLDQFLHLALKPCNATMISTVNIVKWKTIMKKV